MGSSASRREKDALVAVLGLVSILIHDQAVGVFKPVVDARVVAGARIISGAGIVIGSGTRIVVSAHIDARVLLGLIVVVIAVP